MGSGHEVDENGRVSEQSGTLFLLLALINEAMDIDWTKESANYDKYLEDLGDRWFELVNKYSNGFVD